MDKWLFFKKSCHCFFHLNMIPKIIFWIQDWVLIQPNDQSDTQCRFKADSDYTIIFHGPLLLLCLSRYWKMAFRCPFYEKRGFMALGVSLIPLLIFCVICLKAVWISPTLIHWLAHQAFCQKGFARLRTLIRIWPTIFNFFSFRSGLLIFLLKLDSLQWKNWAVLANPGLFTKQ